MQAEYWHDPMNLEEYRKSCVFLPDINQENVSSVWGGGCGWSGHVSRGGVCGWSGHVSRGGV